MDIIKPVVLGIVQGLTEFLPVSSSGHLVLGQKLFGLTEPELLFDVILHTGTLLAVVIIFHKEVIKLALETIRLPITIKSKKSIREAWSSNQDFRMLALIILGSIPTGLIGVLFKDAFKSLFGSTLAVGFALLFTGLLLILTIKVGQTGRLTDRFKASDALIIGAAQGLAITPGVSRSGFTICTALFLGIDRETAARYSFLLSIPAILGALILELRSFQPGAFGGVELTIGFIASFLSGLLALLALLKLVKQGKLHYFAFYCWLIGLVTIGLSLTS